MTFKKTAAIAAVVAAAALGTSMTAANAHAKKHHHRSHLHGHSMIILSTSVDPCMKWYHLYLKTGRIGYLHTYRVCSR